MKFLTLPAELLLDIIRHLSSLQDKCQLLQTCTAMNGFLNTHAACWNHLDLSAYATLTNSILLTFLTRKNIKLITSTGTAMHGITKLDLSGCWCLSQDMVVALSRSFSSLDSLFLNGYRLNSSRKGNNRIALEQQRDHLYQMRPSHDLSSMAMDLSKKTRNQLKITFVSVSYILSQVPSITSLSIQYQDISASSRTSFAEFSHLKYLDITSSSVSPATLQTLLRKVGSGLDSLKMLNIDVTNMSWLCIGQFCKNLKCLYVSCVELEKHLPCIRQALTNLSKLRDFRLTRVLGGGLDRVIEVLDTERIRHLDLSPKMNVYPRGGSKHPIKQSTYATTEHDLRITDVSLHRLSRCHGLVELRLCFPTISADGFHTLFRSIPQLEVFELRQHENKTDYLKGLGYLIKLKRLYLYSVFISIDTADTLTQLPQLKHLTITGQHVDEYRLMNESKALISLDIGTTNTSFIKTEHRWSTIK